MIRLYYTKFLKRFQGNHDIVIQIYYNFGQISAAAVSSRFSRRRLIDFLPRLLYNKTVQGAAPGGRQTRADCGAFIRRLAFLPIASDLGPQRQPASACSGKQKTRLVQDKPCNLLAGETRGVRRGKAATEQRFVRRRRDRVTRNPRRQPRLRVRANKKTRPVQDKPCNLLAGETRGVRSGKAATEQRFAAKAVKRKQTESVGTFLHEFLPIASRATCGVSRVCVFGQIKKHGSYKTSRAICWQGRRDSNTQPTVLETATLPLSHSPKRLSLYNKNFVKSNRFYRFGGGKRSSFYEKTV